MARGSTTAHSLRYLNLQSSQPALVPVWQAESALPPVRRPEASWTDCENRLIIEPSSQP